MITNYKDSIPSNGYANNSGKQNSIKNLIEDFSQERNNNIKIKETRKKILEAITLKNKKTCRAYSQSMYGKNPVYAKLIEYMANILCFYWVAYPSYLVQIEKGDEDIKAEWMRVIFYLEKINPEVLGKDILEKVLINGEIFFAVKETATKKKAKAFGIQELPIEYCRSIRKINNRDVVEINLDFFDKISKAQLQRVLNSYPDYLVKLIINRELCPKDPVTGGRWALIDPDYAFHFSLKKDNLPFFMSVILDLLDLQDTKDINMYKMEQELSKILAVEFPLDDDYNPVFDDYEQATYHNDIVNMLSNIPGIEVVSTMGTVKDIDLSGTAQSQAIDNLQRQYENVYNSAGVSQKLMSADNAGTLSSSVTVNSSILFDFLSKFSDFLNIQVAKIFGENNYIVHMPTVTFFNQKEKVDYYIKQSTYGYSKFLPAICMGQRQSLILSTAWFESQILEMQKIMIPNASSNTTSAAIVTDANNSGNTKAPEERSEKTEQNRESLEGE